MTDHAHSQDRGHNHEGEHRTGSDRVVAFVITVSDRSAHGERTDASGPRAVALLGEAGFAAGSMVVPDGAHSVQQALMAAVDSGARLVITTGGTGVGPRDLTPEGTRPVIGRELPGIAELLRREGTTHNPMAAISRGLAGITAGDRRALIVNLPGAVAAVEQGLAVLLPLVPHILDQVRGGDH